VDWTDWSGTTSRTPVFLYWNTVPRSITDYRIVLWRTGSLRAVVWSLVTQHGNPFHDQKLGGFFFMSSSHASLHVQHWHVTATSSIMESAAQEKDGAYTWMQILSSVYGCRAQSRVLISTVPRRQEHDAVLTMVLCTTMYVLVHPKTSLLRIKHCQGNRSVTGSMTRRGVSEECLVRLFLQHPVDAWRPCQPSCRPFSSHRRCDYTRNLGSKATVQLTPQSYCQSQSSPFGRRADALALHPRRGSARTGGSR